MVIGSYYSHTNPYPALHFKSLVFLPSRPFYKYQRGGGGVNAAQTIRAIYLSSFDKRADPPSEELPNAAYKRIKRNFFTTSKQPVVQY